MKGNDYIMQKSIFLILQDEDIQMQWKNICNLHGITKGYLLLAEEICEDGVVFFQPLKEHRDAYDHIIRTFSIDLKKIPADFDCKAYVAKNLDKAYGHEFRAFFDTADWLSYNLRKTIRIRLRKMSRKEKQRFVQKCGINNLFEKLNQYPFEVAKLRGEKDIAAKSDLQQVEEYRNILDQLSEIYQELKE